MWRRSFLLILLFLVGWAAQIASRRPPDWIGQDPILHPFGLDPSEGPDTTGNGSKPPGPPLVTSDQPLDINRADREQLLALPGVGPVLAGRILAMRDSLHGFERAEQLLAVKGVGPRTLERLIPLIRLR